MPTLSGSNLADFVTPALCLSNTAPSSSVPVRINAAKARAVIFDIYVKNSATSANNGSAITLMQSSDASGTGEKALSFSRYYQNLDASASSTVSLQTASGDTFTTDATASKNQVYRIPVDVSTLDINNGFGFIRVGTGDSTGTTVTVVAHVVPFYGGKAADMPSVLS